MKTKTVYVCVECGAQSPKWIGRCAECSAWNSLHEEKTSVGASKAIPTKASTPLSLADIPEVPAKRWSSGLSEFDRCLGGGMVPGSAVLLGGDPGIGKSTLVLQSALLVKRSASFPNPALYVSAEESPAQVKSRAERLGGGEENLFVVGETGLRSILDMAQRMKPSLLIVDSIQLLADEEFGGSAGSVTQVRECASALIAYAKQNAAALFIVSHVTKDGNLAGPKSIEHMVDTVLSFEGDRRNNYRILRTLKNRFGRSSELGIFEMQGKGLVEVSNAAGLFLETTSEEKPGAFVFPHAEGSRTLLVEIQALVARAVYGTPNRTASGLDRNRLNMLLAVLDKRGGLFLTDQDVYVNAAGGLHVSDPASDLAVALAVASSFLDKTFGEKFGRAVVLGELGLGGEVRPVPALEARLRESAQLGFQTAVIPENGSKTKSFRNLGIHLMPISTLAQALELLERPAKHRG